MQQDEGKAAKQRENPGNQHQGCIGHEGMDDVHKRFCLRQQRQLGH